MASASCAAVAAVPSGARAGGDLRETLYFALRNPKVLVGGVVVLGGLAAAGVGVASLMRGRRRRANAPQAVRAAELERRHNVEAIALPADLAVADDVARVADGYRAIAREAVTVPFDPAMVDGLLRYGSLRPGTQRAWLAAAAAVARGL